VGMEHVVEKLGAAIDRLVTGHGRVNERVALVEPYIQACGSGRDMPAALATGIEIVRSRLIPDKLKRMSEREASLVARQIVFLAHIADDLIREKHPACGRFVS
jgi:hypothetical protein